MKSLQKRIGLSRHKSGIKRQQVKKRAKKKQEGSLIPRRRGSEREGIRGKTTKPRVKDGATLTLRKGHATPFSQLFICPSSQSTSNFLLAPSPLKDKKDSSKRAPAESQMRNQRPGKVIVWSLPWERRGGPEAATACPPPLGTGPARHQDNKDSL